MNLTKFSRCRCGVTLVEVIFSIGVVLIGLVGLVSILPLAGNRAQDSMNLSSGAAVGDGVLKEIQLRKWVRGGSLVDFDTREGVQYPSGLVAGPALTLTDADTNETNNPIVASLCIDPMYVANAIDQGDPAVTYSGYSDITFPYYSTTFDPLSNPSGASVWPAAQPRMRRVGLRNPADTVRPFLTATLEQVRTIVESSNDVIAIRPDDRSKQAEFTGLATDSGLEYGRRAPSGEFTWIATISPLPGNRHASVSVAVIRNRDRARDFPIALPVQTDPKNNGVNERLAYVSFASGFSGGAGGTVHLTASANVSSFLRVGHWIMLSRQVSPMYAVHRWFRVAAINGDPQKFIPQSDTLLETSGAPLPNTTRTDPVWRHKVLLDGPDWAFGLGNNGNTTLSEAERYGDDTFATIMTDVVSVTERVVPINDL